MTAHIFCSVILLLSLETQAADQPPDSSGRDAGERASRTASSVAARRRMLYHLPEGSEIFPLDWLMALTSVKTGKPFLEGPERFGLIPDPEALDIPGLEGVRLPIGLTIGTPPDVLAAVAAIAQAERPPGPPAVRMVGVNCAACHVGRLRYKNKDLSIIEGAPNTFNIDSFYQELFLSAQAVVRDPDKLETFLNDLGKLKAKSEISTRLLMEFERIKKNPSQVGGTQKDAIMKRIADLFEETAHRDKTDAADAKESNEKGPMSGFRKARDLLSNRIEFLKTLSSLHKGGQQLTIPGPGRNDAFGNARRLVFKNAPKIRLNAPVSFPHLWGLGQLHWFHWDGNTNSFMERNIGQAMGLGAIADLETGASTISPLNIHTLESFYSRLAPPTWPEDHFGAVDTASQRYRTGAALFVQHCARCHDRQEGGQNGPEGSITYGLAEIGTDPLRALNFASPLGDGKPFTRDLQAVAEKVKNHAGIEANQAEHRGQLDLPDHQIRWISTLGYVARPLEGAWATAPYLHNGSVPTLDDLLKPEEQRPVCFPLGHREYDPVKLGYVSENTKVPPAEQAHMFVYDTRIEGNSNRGHRYGTQLDSNDRESLLEYLKVMAPPDMFAPGGPQASAGVGIEQVPPSEDSDIQKLKDLQLEQMKMEATLKQTKPVDRGQHPKHHGFLVARFTVDDRIPAELRAGLFREPKKYAAVIRFSSTGEHDDRALDNHGMAIKVLGVMPTRPSEKAKDQQIQSQDFVLLDHPLFFTPNVGSLLAFSQMKKTLVLEKHLTGKALLAAMKESFPNEVRLLEGRKKHINSPLGTEYFSTTPYKLGGTAVKYSAKPEQSKDYLRDVLIEQLQPREQPAPESGARHPAARFGFYIQRQIDPRSMPIEDPTVEWKSAWERVATIEIDAQEFDSPARWDWGNKLSFSPWHALEEHRPLGGINRARKIVYPASFNLRYQNLNSQKEPTEAEVPLKK